jgi:hypothetical protein
MHLFLIAFSKTRCKLVRRLSLLLREHDFLDAPATMTIRCWWHFRCERMSASLRCFGRVRTEPGKLSPVAHSGIDFHELDKSFPVRTRNQESWLSSGAALNGHIYFVNRCLRNGSHKATPPFSGGQLVGNLHVTECSVPEFRGLSRQLIEGKFVHRSTATESDFET